MKIYYYSLFLISLLLSVIYGCMYRKRFNVLITLLFMLIPPTTLGYALLYTSTHINEAIIAIKITYLGGCFLNLFMVYTIFDLSDIKIKSQYRLILLLISSFSFLSALTIGDSSIFYKSISGQMVNGHIVLKKVYGPLHTFYNVQILCYLIICLSVIFYSIRKKLSVSNKILKLLFLCEFLSIAAFFRNKQINSLYDLMPLSYVLNEVILLLIVRRIGLSDVTGTVIESLALNGETGFVSFDDTFNYLGSNNLAREIFPQLKLLKVDKPANHNPEVDREIISPIKDFIINEKKNLFLKPFGDKIYQVEINRIFDGKKRLGYILYIQDDTKDQKYISLLNGFNDKLRDEVNQKTEHIVEMHNNLILGMATMVESRDNSTGGHIKRTSEVVSILIDEILKDKSEDSLKLTPEFCHNLIKAAPMHDLGKIAVDDAILRKPGRFTDEEFEKMKSHASEGARIVHEILKGTDDYAFHRLAENVAHYHHERWDGSGYPKGLKGTEIPLEARIMAVADVYDALVSKRIYKDAMSFEQADKIMMESFGKHFDKLLEKYYVASRPRLEEYYSSQNQ